MNVRMCASPEGRPCRCVARDLGSFGTTKTISANREKDSAFGGRNHGRAQDFPERVAGPVDRMNLSGDSRFPRRLPLPLVALPVEAYMWAIDFSADRLPAMREERVLTSYSKNSI
jgi:hypothetical protein